MLSPRNNFYLTRKIPDLAIIRPNRNLGLMVMVKYIHDNNCFVLDNYK